MKKLITLLFLLIAATAYGQTTGYVERDDCGTITNPATNQVTCKQITTASGRVAGQLYNWNGASWVNISDASGGTAPMFTDITGGTNTAAAMVVGSGASITATGSGSIVATTAAAVAADSVALTTDTTGDYVSGVTANQGLVKTGTEAATVGLLNCTANQIIKKNAGNTAYECQTDSTGGSPSFDTVAAGTNTTAAMVVGTGSSLAVSGTGTIVATSTTGNAATVTTNANLTGPILSSGNATSIAAQTGTGNVFVMQVGSSLTNANLNTPSAITLTNGTGLPVSTGVSGLGTGVGTALQVNAGSAGAVVVNGGALGTPTSGVATNITALNANELTTGTIPGAANTIALLDGSQESCPDDSVGGNDTYTCNLPTAITTYVLDSAILFTPLTVNTGPATVDVSSIGTPQSILKHDGTALADGDLQATLPYRLTHDGSAYRLPAGAGVGTVGPGTIGKQAVFDTTTTVADGICSESGGTTISCGDVSTNAHVMDYATNPPTGQVNHAWPDQSGTITYNKSITFVIGSDQGAVLADADDQPTMWRNNIAAMTITEVWCESDAGTPIINLQRDDGTAADILSSNLTCTTGGAVTSTFSGSEASLAVSNKLDFVMITAGGTAKRITVSILATLD